MEEKANIASPPPYLLHFLKSIPGFHRLEVLRVKDKSNVLSFHSDVAHEDRITKDILALVQAATEFVSAVTSGNSLEEVHWSDDTSAYFLIPALEESFILFFVFRLEGFDLKTTQHSIRQFIPSLFYHLRSTLEPQRK